MFSPLLLAAVLAPPPDAAPDPAAELRRDAEFAITTWADSLAAAETAVGRAAGRMQTGLLQDVPHTRNLTREVDVRFVFDRSRDALATDTRTTEGEGTRRIRYVTSETRTIQYGSDAEPTGTVAVVAGPSPEPLVANGGHPFDPLSMTSTDIGFRNRGLARVRADLLDWGREIESIKKREDGTWDLYWFTEESTLRARVRRWTVDPARGFLPVRSRMYITPGRVLPDLEVTLESESSVEWADRGGVWVPVSLHNAYHYGYDEPQTIDLAFEWEAVNAPLPPEAFTWRGLELEPGSQVYDRRLGELIEVHREPRAAAAAVEGD